MKRLTHPLTAGADPRKNVVDAIHQLFDQVDQLQHAANGAVAEAASRLGRCELAVLIMGARRERKRHFDAHLFGEPGWDILLDLYVSYCRDETVDITGASIASGVAQTTALRYLRDLEESGLIEREADPHDLRRKLVTISDQGLQRVEAYLDGYSQWVMSHH